MQTELISTIRVLLLNAAILVFAIGVLLALVFAYREGRQYLQHRGLLDEFDNFKDIVEKVVRALEQEGVVASYTNTQKKEIAFNTLREMALRANLPIHNKTINLLIEAAVQLMNQGQGKFDIGVRG
jgi:predicted histidine transporter YuiF (NhaC family)